jgi:hypothetical protein
MLESRVGGRAALRSVTRAAIAVAHSDQFQNAEATARQMFPDDKAAARMVTRIVTAPELTTTATDLAATTASDLVAGLMGASAAARLINAGLRVPLPGLNTVTIPRRKDAGAPTAVAFIGEGAAIGVEQGEVNTVTLGPTTKLASIISLSREQLEFGHGASLEILTRENLAATLDSFSFDDTAASATRPAGLLNGLVPLTPSVEADPRVAMLMDLHALGAAVTDSGSAVESVVYIAAPRQALMLLQICGAADRVAEYSETIARDGAVIRTKTGLRDHPLLKHELAARSFIVRALHRLGFDIEPPRDVVGRPPGVFPRGKP